MLDAKRKILDTHTIFANCMTSGKRDSQFVMTVALGTLDVSSLEMIRVFILNIFSIFVNICLYNVIVLCTEYLMHNLKQIMIILEKN